MYSINKIYARNIVLRIIASSHPPNKLMRRKIPENLCLLAEDETHESDQVFCMLSLFLPLFASLPPRCQSAVYILFVIRLCFFFSLLHSSGTNTVHCLYTFYVFIDSRIGNCSEPKQRRKKNQND